MRVMEAWINNTIIQCEGILIVNFSFYFYLVIWPYKFKARYTRTHLYVSRCTSQTSRSTHPRPFARFYFSPERERERERECLVVRTRCVGTATRLAHCLFTIHSHVRILSQRKSRFRTCAQFIGSIANSLFACCNSNKPAIFEAIEFLLQRFAPYIIHNNL